MEIGKYVGDLGEFGACSKIEPKEMEHLKEKDFIGGMREKQWERNAQNECSYLFKTIKRDPNV